MEKFIAIIIDEDGDSIKSYEIEAENQDQACDKLAKRFFPLLDGIDCNNFYDLISALNVDVKWVENNIPIKI